MKQKESLKIKIKKLFEKSLTNNERCDIMAQNQADLVSQ